MAGESVENSRSCLSDGPASSREREREKERKKERKRKCEREREREQEGHADDNCFFGVG